MNDQVCNSSSDTLKKEYVIEMLQDDKKRMNKTDETIYRSIIGILTALEKQYPQMTIEMIIDMMKREKDNNMI